MDFLDPKKRKAHSRRLFLGYLLMAVALAFGSLILLFRTYGYDLDRKTGKIIQNGLVYISTKPASAKILLNGQDRGNTNTRLTIPAERYALKLESEGYKEWKKTFVLEGASVEQLVYPLLFPTKLSRSDIMSYSSRPALAAASPNRQRLLVAKPGSVSKFDLFDLNNVDKSPTPISLPDGLLNETAANNKLSLVEWSTNSRYVLLKHVFKGGSEFLIIDVRNPSDSFNLNETLSVNPTSVRLRDGRFNSYFIYRGASKRLQTATLNNPTPTPFISSVNEFQAHEQNKVLYTTSSGAAKGWVLVKIRDGNETYTLRKLPKADSHLLELAEYKGRLFAAAGVASEDRIYIYNDPVAILKQKDPALLPPAVILRINNPNTVSVTKNSRFIAAQNGDDFAVYDSETDRRFYYTIGRTPDKNQPAEWMDGHRLIVTVKGRIFVFDFDGFNKRYLTPAYSAADVFFDSDFERLYAISPSVKATKKPALTATELRVNN